MAKDMFATANHDQSFNKITDDPSQSLPGDSDNVGDENENRFVAFLTIEEVEIDDENQTTGESFPVDYEKEYFPTKADAEEYIEVMRGSDSMISIEGKTYGGYVVPIEKEQEAEDHLVRVIDSGSYTPEQDEEGKGLLPKSGTGQMDNEAGGWAESKWYSLKPLSEGFTGDKYFDIIEFFRKKFPEATEYETIQYLTTKKNFTESEANAIAVTYRAYSPLSLRE